jgi:hypothetical protein
LYNVKENRVQEKERKFTASKMIELMSVWSSYFLISYGMAIVVSIPGAVFITVLIAEGSKLKAWHVTEFHLSLSWATNK